MELKYFDWQGPAFLERVARTLIARYRVGSRLDFSSVIIAMPGSHALKRLERCLVRLTQELADAGEISHDWYPPNLITVGALPTLLYPQKRPLAGNVTQAFVWQAVLREFADQKPEQLKKLIPGGLSGDLVQEMDFGRMLAVLHRELAAEEKQFADVAREQTSLGINPEIERWLTLQDLQNGYLKRLEEVHLWDMQTANLVAVQKKECQTEQEVYLLGAVDLNKLQKKILQEIESHVHIFVYAPESERDRFDEFGCVRPDAWQDCSFPIDDSQITAADSVGQEATLVADWLFPDEVALDETMRSQRLENTALCIPNESQEEFLPFLEEELSPLGIAVTPPGGSAMRKNRVYKLLEVAASWIRSRTFKAFSDLVRHPDVELYLLRHWSEGPDPELVPGDWLSELDELQENSLPEYLDFNWYKHLCLHEVGRELAPASEEEEEDESLASVTSNSQNENNNSREFTFVQLAHVAVLIEDLFQPFFTVGHDSLLRRRERPDRDGTHGHKAEATEPDTISSLREALQAATRVWFQTEECFKTLLPWCSCLSEFLNRVYNTAGWNADNLPEVSFLADDHDNDTILALHQVRDGLKNVFQVFDEFAQVPASLQTAIPGSTFVGLLLSCLTRGQISGIRRKQEIKLTGWLDAALDDSPQLAIVGMNEGRIPSSQSEDLFLPDSIRGKLVLNDSRARIARDAYVLTAICHGRPNVHFFFERRSLAGDELLPSRFLLTADPERIPERICLFFPEDSTPDVVPAGFVTQQGPSSGPDTLQVEDVFQPPVLRMSGPEPKSMRVTEFKEFLESPYIYFLTRQLQLVRRRDNALEMKATTTGNIVHDILFHFAQDENMKHCTDEKVLFDFLSTRLDRLAAGIFGRNATALLPIQIEQLRRRLWRFAKWQASWTARGNMIFFCEKSPSNSVRLIVDGVATTIRGRIDRIDYNISENRWYVFDYKTFSSWKQGKGKKDQLPPGECLFSDCYGNTVDLRHRSGPKEQPWSDLQLPLYRLLFQTLMREHQYELSPEQLKAPVSLGYIVLPVDSETMALGAPWNDLEFNDAIGIAHWVIQVIRRLWRVGVDPRGVLDENYPERGLILDEKLPDYLKSEFSGITGLFASNWNTSKRDVPRE
ncbi:MAG: PD-(D/E)XK nuclease family protein [Planctomycetia bacterium]|nr:PD-(D/E)XK nuclease family protein [Planctomycetia bacterium]